MRHECIILAKHPGAFVELCGISLLERQLRTLQRCGLERAIVLSANPEVLVSRLTSRSPHRAKIALEIRSRADGPLTVEQISALWPNDSQALLLIAGDRVFDSRLLRLLDEQHSTTALVDSAPPGSLRALVAGAPNTTRGRFCGATLLSREWVRTHEGGFDEVLREEIEHDRIGVMNIASRAWYFGSLRRELRPYWFPAPPPGEQRNAERVLLDATQKGALDFPALIHAPIENFLISHLCKRAITPNQLTAITSIVAWTATFLFATGHLAGGTLLALAVGVLDGLDGKLARLKVETSKLGKLEHWLDALFENSWWIALAYNFQNSGRFPAAFVYLALLIGAQAVEALAKLGVIRLCGRTLDELGDFNRVVRLIGGRRNIYIWLFALGLLSGAPVHAFQMIAWWGAVTAAVQVARAAFAVRGQYQKKKCLQSQPETGLLDAAPATAIRDE